MHRCKRESSYIETSALLHGETMSESVPAVQGCCCCSRNLIEPPPIVALAVALDWSESFAGRKSQRCTFEWRRCTDR